MIRLIVAIVLALVVLAAGGGQSEYRLQKCMRGPSLDYEPRSCIEYDLDDDGDVDLQDWADWILYCPDGCEKP